MYAIMQSQNNLYDITGKLVHAQLAFPSGTTVSCYGTDSTCSGMPNDMTLDYADNGEFVVGFSSRNFCCFINFPFQHLSGNYYTALGSRCQSCSGKKLFKLWLVILQKLDI